MNAQIRPISTTDKSAVLSMMQDFYSSDAVLSNGSDEIFLSDIETCIAGSPYLEGYVIETAKETQGYMMIAKSFSTEFGKPCIWIEDLYIKESYRGQGLGNMFIDFITGKYQGCIFRLEVEKENKSAVKLYEKCGFNFLPYNEMVRL